MTRLVAVATAALFTRSASAPAVWAQGAATPPPTAAAKPADKKSGPIDINTASAEELQKLRGIGEAYAKKIIQNRPYHGKDELVSKNVIPKATYDKIKGRIIAKQPAAKK